MPLYRVKLLLRTATGNKDRTIEIEAKNADEARLKAQDGRQVVTIYWVRKS